MTNYATLKTLYEEIKNACGINEKRYKSSPSKEKGNLIFEAQDSISAVGKITELMMMITNMNMYQMIQKNQAGRSWGES